MKLKTHLKSQLISSLLVTALCVTQASALEYGFDGADDYLFADPTSQDVIYQAEDQNVNRSKTATLIAPGFGTPTSYLRGSGEYLTPNLAPGAMSGGLVNAVGNYGYTDSSPGGYPATDTSISAGTYPPAGNENFTTSTIGYTDVTSDLYYSGGHLGTLKIPSIGVNVKIYQGTDSATLAKGAGHFTDTSIWAGNVCVAGHNRGTNGCGFPPWRNPRSAGALTPLRTAPAMTTSMRRRCAALRRIGWWASMPPGFLLRSIRAGR